MNVGGVPLFDTTGANAPIDTGGAAGAGLGASKEGGGWSRLGASDVFFIVSASKAPNDSSSPMRSCAFGAAPSTGKDIACGSGDGGAGH